MTESIESQLERLQLTDPLEILSQSEIEKIPRIKKINYLELFNFKSYADYHYIGPLLDFSCIIGPNGGGKSNILDALCFLFCINPKNSRVYSLTELIYNRAKVQGGKTMVEQRECWVSGSFACGGTDALKLQRTLNSSGNSEFFINNQKVDIEEYHQTLYRNNINTFAKNFLIMQGEAVSLIEKSPKDLSLFFEYLSGSIAHKNKYDELKAAADEKEKELKEQSHKLGSLKSERRKIREKIENSKEYNKLLEEYDQAELLNQLVKLVEIDKQCYDNLKVLQGCEQEVEGYKARRENENIQLQSLTVGKRNLQANIRKEQKNLEGKKEEVSVLRSELTKDGTLKEMTEQTIQAKKISRERFEREWKALQSSQKDYETGIEELERKLIDVGKEIEKKKSDPSENLAGKDYDEYRELTQKLKIRSHLLSQELEKLYNEQKIIVTRIEKMEEDNMRRKNTVAKLEGELSGAKGILAGRQEEVKRLAEEEKRLYEQIGEVSKRKAEKVEGRSSLQSLRDEKNKRLMNHELLTMNQKEESRTTQLKIELSMKAKGFKDELRYLIQPISAPYEAALKLALGPAVRYLVVDKDETAMICSSILKDKSVMKDLLILENIPEVNMQALVNIRNQLAGLGNLAFDVVDFKRNVVGLERALLFLLQGKVVCQNLARAEAIRKKNIEGVKQIITLDGSIVKKGVIVGYGNVENLKLGGQFGGASIAEGLEEELRTIQKEIQQFEEAIKGLKTDDEDLELHRLSEKLREIEGKLNVEKEEISKLQNKYNKDEDDLAREKAELNRSAGEVAKLAQGRSRVEGDTVAVKSKFEKLEEEVFGAFCQKRGIGSVKEFRGQNLVEYEKTLEEKEKLEKKIKILKKEKSELPLARYEEMVHELTGTIRDKEALLEEIKTRVAMNNKKIETASTAYQNAKAMMEKYVQEDVRLDKEISEMEKGLEGNRARYVEMEKERKDAINKVNQLLQKKKETVEELQIKSIEVPEAGAREVNTPRDLFEDYEGLIKKYFAAVNGQIDIDYSLLLQIEGKVEKKEMEQEKNENAMEIEEKSEEEVGFNKWFESLNNEILTRRREEYEATLVTLGHKIDTYAGTSFPVGQDSSKRVKKYEKEIDETKAIVGELTKEHDQAVKLFEQVKQVRVEKFDTFFEKLAGKIDEVYKSLTRRADGVVGKAILYKENKDEPYNGGVFYSATPPSKKFVYDVEQLSGGEKTMAGLALILTANLVSEFPFMFFDESDAFLDKDNTKQLLEVFKLFVERNLLQILVVTHKNMIYGNAQSLVGATFVPRQATSEAYSLDLRKEA